MNALQFPNTVKGGLRCYLKSLAMRPGSEGKDTLEIMYSFLQARAEFYLSWCSVVNY